MHLFVESQAAKKRSDPSKKEQKQWQQVKYIFSAWYAISVLEISKWSDNQIKMATVEYLSETYKILSYVDRIITELNA
jgi:hypothetical protein